MVKKPVAHMFVDKDFFDNVFEKERKKLGKQKGISFTQRTFTEFLVKRKVKFVLQNDDKFLSKEAKRLKKR